LKRWPALLPACFRLRQWLTPLQDCLLFSY
jgi:hypothetical protein